MATTEDGSTGTATRPDVQYEPVPFRSLGNAWFTVIRQDKDYPPVSETEGDNKSEDEAKGTVLKLRAMPGSIWPGSPSAPARNIVVFDQHPDAACFAFSRLNQTVNPEVACGINELPEIDPFAVQQDNSALVSFGKPSRTWCVAVDIMCTKFSNYGEQAGVFIYLNDSNWVKVVLEYLKGVVKVVFALIRDNSVKKMEKIVLDEKFINKDAETASVRMRLDVDCTGTLTAMLEPPLGSDLRSTTSQPDVIGRFEGEYFDIDAEADGEAGHASGLPFVALGAHGGASDDACLTATFSNLSYGWRNPLASGEGRDTTEFLRQIESIIKFRRVRASDVPRVNEIEQAGYPSDEAALRKTMEMRQREAADYFLVAEADINKLLVLRPTSSTDNSSSEPSVQVIGYVCSTASRGETLEHDTMTQHDPAGETLCIHSVCVDTRFQKMGIASLMLEQYLARLRVARQGLRKDQFPIKRVLLISKERNLGLYKRAGFKVDGPSDVVHGRDQWFQCSYVL